MWVKFTSTYSGPQGLFPKGIKRDLPKNVLDAISKDFYEKTVAPWNEKAVDSASNKLQRMLSGLSSKERGIASLELSVELLSDELEDYISLIGDAKNEYDNLKQKVLDEESKPKTKSRQPKPAEPAKPSEQGENSANAQGQDDSAEQGRNADQVKGRKAKGKKAKGKRAKGKK